MSVFLRKIQNLVADDQLRVSEHGYDELVNDDIFLEDVLISLQEAIVVEEYPDYHKGPCVLVLQHDDEQKPIHVLWGIPRGKERPAVLITAYRPDPERWSSDFLRRA